MTRPFACSRRTFARTLLGAPALLVPVPAFAAGNYTAFDEDFADATSDEPYHASYLAAAISDIVYHEQDYRNRMWGRLGLTEVNFLRKAHVDAEAALVASDDYLVLAVRGSKQIKDWVEDTDEGKTQTWSKAEIKVHNGFRLQAAALMDWANKSIEVYRGDRKLWVVGHSLGGAVANLMAYGLARDAGVGIDGVMTFGAPRASGDNRRHHYQDLLGSVSRRWINQHDPIPHSPPGKGWRSVGKRSVIRKHDKLHFDVGSMPDPDWPHMMDYHRCPKYLVSLWRGMGGKRHGTMPRPDDICK